MSSKIHITDHNRLATIDYQIYCIYIIFVTPVYSDMKELK